MRHSLCCLRGHQVQEPDFQNTVRTLRSRCSKKIYLIEDFVDFLPALSIVNTLAWARFYQQATHHQPGTRFAIGIILSTYNHLNECRILVKFVTPSSSSLISGLPLRRGLLRLGELLLLHHFPCETCHHLVYGQLSRPKKESNV